MFQYPLTNAMGELGKRISESCISWYPLASKKIRKKIQVTQNNISVFAEAII